MDAARACDHLAKHNHFTKLVRAQDFLLSGTQRYRVRPAEGPWRGWVPVLKDSRLIACVVR